MAERIDSFEFPGRGRPGGYPWDEWLDGTIWRVEREKDFPGTVFKHFRNQLYSAAAKRNVRVRVAVVDEDVIVFQAYTPGGEA